MTQAIARRRSGYTHDVEINGHTVVVDEPVDSGGADLGASPTSLLAVALASCTAITIEMYADRKGWALDNLAVSATYDGPPNGAEAARLEVTVHLPGGLSEEQTERIMVIAAKCPVHKVLSAGAEVSHTHTTAPPGSETASNQDADS